jgi:hypothetical protein
MASLTLTILGGHRGRLTHRLSSHLPESCVISGKTSSPHLLLVWRASVTSPGLEGRQGVAPTVRLGTDGLRNVLQRSGGPARGVDLWPAAASFNLGRPGTHAPRRLCRPSGPCGAFTYREFPDLTVGAITWRPSGPEAPPWRADRDTSSRSSVNSESRQQPIQPPGRFTYSTCPGRAVRSTTSRAFHQCGG